MPFFVELDKRLTASGVSLSVIHGTNDALGADGYPWRVQRPNRALRLGGRELLWQPALAEVRSADLVIVEQASRLILNYYLAARQALGRGKLALWGHGKNFQARTGDFVAELVKKRVSTMAHWWFAYNELTKSIVESLGFPAERITNVQNATDTTTLRELAAEVTQADRERTLRSLGLRGESVGIFCGRMYAEKRLDFLLRAAELVRARVPTFELVLIGSGPDEHLARAAADEHPWVRFVGPMYDRAKAELFAISHVFLMPGAVGLAILDGFALSAPMITTSDPHHGPEIGYLEPGVNGVITADDVGSYAEAIAVLLSEPRALESMRSNAREAAKVYTIENMADNFHRGVLQALSTS